MLKELLEKIEASEIFKSKHIPSTHLTHIFIMPPVQAPIDSAKTLSDLPNTEFHAGFYNPKTSKIGVFKYLNDVIEYLPEDDVFQKEKNLIPEISIADAKLSFSQVAKIFLDKIKTTYKGAFPLKLLCILQKLDVGFVWNFTLLRGDFKTLNIKIDAQTGEILEESLAGLISD